ncbi:hypothetical protein C8J56DRAFT_914149 [Mycena floridula]|nr:hypothetical protein C8J56DRAFT_914149 [Mycena floridula]
MLLSTLVSAAVYLATFTLAVPISSTNQGSESLAARAGTDTVAVQGRFANDLTLQTRGSSDDSPVTLSRRAKPKCPNCGKEFTNEKQLAEHRALAQRDPSLCKAKSTEKLVKCPKCSAMIPESKVKQHASTHGGPRPRPGEDSASLPPH